jgi:inorganic pyrophosphatase
MATGRQCAYNRQHFSAKTAAFTGLQRGQRLMSYSKIPAGKDLPNDIYVAIEIPANHQIRDRQGQRLPVR